MTLTPAELTTLRHWAHLLDPANATSGGVTAGRHPEDALSIAVFADAEAFGTRPAQLRTLVQVSVADLLLFRRAFLALAAAQERAAALEAAVTEASAMLREVKKEEAVLIDRHETGDDECYWCRAPFVYRSATSTYAVKHTDTCLSRRIAAWIKRVRTLTRRA